MHAHMLMMVYKCQHSHHGSSVHPSLSGSFVPAVLWRYNKHSQWTNTRLAVWLFVDLCSKSLNDKGHVIDFRSCIVCEGIVCVRCSSLFHDLRNETQVWSAGLLITQHGIRLAQSSMTVMLEILSVAAEYSCAAVAESTLNLFHHLEALFQQGCLVKHCQNKCSGFLKKRTLRGT